jgi:hypothetical protein
MSQRRQAKAYEVIFHVVQKIFKDDPVSGGSFLAVGIFLLAWYEGRCVINPCLGWLNIVSPWESVIEQRFCQREIRAGV